MRSGVGIPRSNFVHIDTGPHGTGSNCLTKQGSMNYYFGHRILPECSLIWCEQTRLAALVDPAAMRKKSTGS
ncbi:metal-binding hydrolase [Escherichia coli]|uniref:Metal-binding hydrolase n=1 Tax=Escherichia coli TaxID=562 RepID=A0A376TIY7_ECOLX|nr:metal-binding hydrolase [Escherichia coli]